MTAYATDFLIRPEDGWTLVATNPAQLLIKAAVYHPWWVAITDASTPAATVVGVPMGRDPSNRNESYYLANGVTGLVYVRIGTPTDSDSFEKMAFSVTTAPSGGGGGGGSVTQGTSPWVTDEARIVWTQSIVTLSAATSATLIAANANRKALRWMVTGTNPMTVAPGAVTVTVNQGLNYSPGSASGFQGGSDSFGPNEISVAAYSAISTLGTTVAVWEGV